MESKIYLDDCFTVLPQLPDHVVDLVLADLPFGKTDFAWDDPDFDLKTFWNQVIRVLKPNGVVACHAVQPFTTCLIVSNPTWFKYTYVWIKTQAANFQLAKLMPLKKHEDVVIFYNRRPVYHPQMRKGVPKFKRSGPTVYQQRKSVMYLASRPANLSLVKSDTYYPTTVLDGFPSLPRNRSRHPTQKPVALAEFFIKTYTDPGGLVLDPTMGVGTTCLAAIATGRRFIGIEKVPQYFDEASRAIRSAE